MARLRRRQPEEQLIKVNVNRQAGSIFVRQAECIDCHRCHYTGSYLPNATENGWCGNNGQL